MNDEDRKLLEAAMTAMRSAEASLKKVWERHSGLKADPFGVVRDAPSDADLRGDAPMEIQYAIASLSDAMGFINDVNGG